VSRRRSTSRRGSRWPNALGIVLVVVVFALGSALWATAGAAPVVVAVLVVAVLAAFDGARSHGRKRRRH
jgi:hypothetical protein